MLTPQEVREATFDTHLFREGYDTDQVDAMMDECAATIDSLTRIVQALSERLGLHDGYRVYSGTIAGASFYDAENDEPRETPRLYIDVDEDIPVSAGRVHILETLPSKKGTNNEQ